MTAPRTYTVGLPVAITVQDDGTVTYEVDFSEADAAPDEWDDSCMTMFEPDGEPLTVTDELRAADAERIREWLDARPSQ